MSDNCTGKIRMQKVIYAISGCVILIEPVKCKLKEGHLVKKEES